MFQAWRQLRHVSALRDTEYGRLLVIKVVVVAVVVAVGATSRSLLRVRGRALVPAGGVAGDEPVMDDEAHRGLHVRVGLEAVLGVAVVVVTSLLVAANPTSSLATKQFSGAKVVQGTVIEADAVPTRPGPITFHLYASDPSAGLRTEFQERATLSLPARGITGVNVLTIHASAYQQLRWDGAAPPAVLGDQRCRLV